uniref:Uncharacterized protein n=1 Tax=Arundo donax TaxID=35708 RepID=A0A0A8ZV51_ARUDO
MHQEEGGMPLTIDPLSSSSSSLHVNPSLHRPSVLGMALTNAVELMAS